MGDACFTIKHLQCKLESTISTVWRFEDLIWTHRSNPTRRLSQWTDRLAAIMFVKYYYCCNLCLRYVTQTHDLNCTITIFVFQLDKRSFKIFLNKTRQRKKWYLLMAVSINKYALICRKRINNYSKLDWIWKTEAVFEFDCDWFKKNSID